MSRAGWVIARPRAASICPSRSRASGEGCGGGAGAARGRRGVAREMDGRRSAGLAQIKTGEVLKDYLVSYAIPAASSLVVDSPSLSPSRFMSPQAITGSILFPFMPLSSFAPRRVDALPSFSGRAAPRKVCPGPCTPSDPLALPRLPEVLLRVAALLELEHGWRPCMAMGAISRSACCRHVEIRAAKTTYI